ncbi:hypothetical protein PR048_029959 [Dryococelus australis]|uniref:Uncharacterized protein n=1 Tax=Dryococelus australis TaxID=614101 RepID=A0ABQ9G840_9NEOP|nr:hypothetical protein PR048_029959 [Dryococelus australis]
MRDFESSPRVQPVTSSGATQYVNVGTPKLLRPVRALSGKRTCEEFYSRSDFVGVSALRTGRPRANVLCLVIECRSGDRRNMRRPIDSRALQPQGEPRPAVSWFGAVVRARAARPQHPHTPQRGHCLAPFTCRPPSAFTFSVCVRARRLRGFSRVGVRAARSTARPIITPRTPAAGSASFISARARTRRIVSELARRTPSKEVSLIPMFDLHLNCDVSARDCSPLSKANLVRFSAVSLPDAAVGRVFSGISSFPRSCIPALHAHLLSRPVKSRPHRIARKQQIVHVLFSGEVCMERKQLVLACDKESEKGKKTVRRSASSSLLPTIRLTKNGWTVIPSLYDALPRADTPVPDGITFLNTAVLFSSRYSLCELSGVGLGCILLDIPRSSFPPPACGVPEEVHRYDGNTARLTRRGDETLVVRVSVARIAPSLLDLRRGLPTGVQSHS